MGNRLRGPLHERLPQEGGTLQSPVHPALVAAALGDERNADVLLHSGGTAVALALFTEGCKQPRGERLAGAGQRAKQCVIG